jgi:MoaA/NifB/PqqE/SkfB family radical SAM enzyme
VANLVVSSVCNRSCAYCFTTDQPRPAGEPFLPLPLFEERLEFLTRSDIREARLLGGEPTLHPRFGELVDLARAAGKAVVVFTNGLMPDKALTRLASLAPGECTVMVNVTAPDDGGANGTVERQRATMRRLGERALPGFTLYRPGLALDFLLRLVTETGCQRSIRLGMAHPCLSGSNRYLHPGRYRAVAVEIVRFARVAADEGITLYLDCGFVRCTFSDADLQRLRDAGVDAGWHCNPILDVDISGNVIHCFPLAGLGSLPLTAQSEAGAFRRAFEAMTGMYRQAGVFRECSNCHFKAAGECPGGCLAATIRRFRHTPFHLALPRGVAA